MAVTIVHISYISIFANECIGCYFRYVVHNTITIIHVNTVALIGCIAFVKSIVMYFVYPRIIHINTIIIKILYDIIFNGDIVGS